MVMKKDTQSIDGDMGAIADDARNLMTATVEKAGEKVNDARKRLTTALESGGEIYDRVQDKAVKVARSSSQAVHNHPYPVIGLALGVGVLIGYLLTRLGNR
jgi:ElaB/YqjD/DUF883 family membrane-anchored ribosome-binding protein